MVGQRGERLCQAQPVPRRPGRARPRPNAGSDLRCSSWRLSANYMPHGEGLSHTPQLLKPTSGTVFKSSPQLPCGLFISLGFPLAIS